MERLDMDDIRLIQMMGIELEKLFNEVKEDLTANPGVQGDLGSLFDTAEGLAIMMVMIYSVMDPNVRRRLDAVADMYREACA